MYAKLAKWNHIKYGMKFEQDVDGKVFRCMLCCRVCFVQKELMRLYLCRLYLTLFDFRLVHSACFLYIRQGLLVQFRVSDSAVVPQK